MKSLDRAILKSLYINSLDPSRSFLHYIEETCQIDKNFVKSRLLELITLGFVEEIDNKHFRLSTIGREALKIVLVGGVFDILHPGHISTLKAAKSHGDVLVVIIATVSTATKIKKGRLIYHKEELRRELVSSLRFVDLALIGKKGTLFDTVEYVKPDIIALGYDQTHSEKYISENCKKRNLEVRIVRLNTPIPKMKSSEIKRELGDSVYNI